MKRFKKGFTLIELLVVIAIIGILAAIVLASLSTARSKAKDAKGEGELAEMRSAAEIYYSSNPSTGYDNGTVTANCALAGDLFTDPNSGMNGLTQALGGTSYGVTTNGDVINLTCNTNGTAWAADGALSNGNYWCVDSSGKSENAGATKVTGVSCP